MTRSQLIQFSVLGAVVIASIISSVAIQRRASVQQAEREAALREQNEALSNIAVENGRLSNLVERTHGAEKLSQSDLRELAKLRGQVGVLRGSEKEKSALAKTNAQLRTAIAESEKKIAEAQASPNYWSQDQLAPAGYADPESTMKTMLWAAKNGEVTSWKSSCTPHARQQLESEWKKHGKTEPEQIADLKQMGTALTASATGFRIVSQEMPAPDEAVIKLQFVGEGKERQFVLKRIDGEWKFHDLLFAGQKRVRKQETAH
jgi:hypothetical protein